jgi:hypothetical protein
MLVTRPESGDPVGKWYAKWRMSVRILRCLDAEYSERRIQTMPVVPVERTVNELEKRLSKNVSEQNKVCDLIAKLEKRVKALEERVTKNTTDQNRVNQRAHDEIAKLDRRVKRLE